MLIPINLFNILHHGPEGSSPFSFYCFLAVHLCPVESFSFCAGRSLTESKRREPPPVAACLLPVHQPPGRKLSFLHEVYLVRPATYTIASRQGKKTTLFSEQVQLKPLFDRLLNCRRYRRRYPAVKGIGNQIFGT